MEASLILARLVQKLEPTLVPGFEPELYPKLTMSSKNGMRTIVTPREVAK
jgi:cytochrome P450